MNETDSVVISLRISKDNKAKLEGIAKKEYRKLQDQVRLILDSWVEKNADA